MTMVGYKMAKCVKFLVMAVLFCLIGGLVVKGLWNWLMPAIFGLRVLTFWQALGLLALSKILLGGFHRHGSGRRGEWKREMKARWGRMSPEEQERFRSGMRGRRDCGWGREKDNAAEQSAQ